MARSWSSISARAVALALAVATTQCGRSAIEAHRLEGAIGPTFANLVHLELARLHMPAPRASDLQVKVYCHKVGTSGATDGPGDWACTLLWSGPGSKGTLRDTYGVAVTNDGCYTASAEGAEGEEAHVGGPMLVGPDGAPVPNLLFSFEGCFDTT